MENYKIIAGAMRRHRLSSAMLTVVVCFDYLQFKDTLSFLVTIKDKVNADGGDSENDNLVEVPIRVIVLDENDNAPEFQNVSPRFKFPLFTGISNFPGEWRLICSNENCAECELINFTGKLFIIPVSISILSKKYHSQAPNVPPQVPYETEILENTPPGTTVFSGILVTDKDTVGEILNVTCSSAPQPYAIKTISARPVDPCSK